MGSEQALSCTTAIVSYKTPELATACARSVRRAGITGPLAIVETGEKPSLPAALPQLNAVLHRLSNVGYAAALAHIFDTADTPLLLALNADVELADEPAQPLLDLFAEKPGLGILGVRQRDSRGFLTHCGICDPGSPDGGQAFGEVDQGQFHERYAVIAQVSGSAMLIRTAAYAQCGRMGGMPKLYYEDAILCLRLRRKGWAVGYSGLSTWTHNIASSPSDDRAQLAAEGRQVWAAEVAAGLGT